MESQQYPNMKSMFITIYVHHMDVDVMYDYINGRISNPPIYWINPRDLPESISGGYLEMHVTYEIYTLIREIQDHSTFGDL